MINTFLTFVNFLKLKSYYLKKKFNKNLLPLKVTIALTFLCNSQCKSCKIWKIYKNNPEKLKKELSLKEWKKIFDELKDVLWLEFTGGEPFLKKDIEKILVYAFNKTNLIAAGISSNAVNPIKSFNSIKKIIENIPKHKIMNVAISLDGDPKKHNNVRGVNGNFENAMWLYKNLKILQQKYKNLKVRFTYTISKWNAGNYLKTYKYLHKNFREATEDFSNFVLQHFTDFYNLPNREKNFYKKMRKKIYDDVINYTKIMNEKKVKKDFYSKIRHAFYIYYAKKILIFINNPKKMILPCYAGTDSAYIDPYGNVYPCLSWNIKLGNLKEKSFREIWFDKKAEKIRKLIKKEKCPNCWTPCEAQHNWFVNCLNLKNIFRLLKNEQK